LALTFSKPISTMQSYLYRTVIYSIAFQVHPSEIFNDPQNKTYANKEEAKRAGILDAVEPELKAVKEMINKMFAPKNGKGKIYVVEYDLSVMPEMQIDQKAMAEALDKQWYATGNEKRVVMKWGEETRPGFKDLMNDYMIPSGLTPSQQLTGDLSSLDVSNDGSI